MQDDTACICDIRFKAFQVREADGPFVRSGRDFAEGFKSIASLDREAFFVVTLTTKNQAINHYLVALGTLTASLVHPREVFRSAIQDSAAAIACIHNHPSGDPTPSAEDRAITKRLYQAAQLLGIRFLDHVIIARNGYVSFLDAGLLKEDCTCSSNAITKTEWSTGLSGSLTGSIRPS
jgi:DNA repair protein RadC